MKYIVLASLMLFTVACEKSSDGTETSTTNTETTVTPPVTPTTPSTPTTPTEPPVVEVPSNTTSEEKVMIEEFMELINDHRISIGLRPLTHDDEMGKIATQHSVNMANGSVAFGHTGFSSRCSASRTAMGGGNWCGENVAKGQKTVQAAFTSWMNSSGHRANIEKSAATHTGFGFKKSASGTWYWTQIFLQVY